MTSELCVVTAGCRRLCGTCYLQ